VCVQCVLRRPGAFPVAILSLTVILMGKHFSSSWTAATSEIRDAYKEVLDPLPVERGGGRPANQRPTGPTPQTNNRRELSRWEIVTPGYPI
jgi:hypothetical protein